MSKTRTVKRKRKRKVRMSALLTVAAVAAFAVFLLMWILDHPAVIIKVNEEKVTLAEAGTEFEDPGATAYYRKTILPYPREEIEVTAESNIDTQTLGTYEITYTASHGRYSSTATRQVEVKDTQAPVITLENEEDAYTLPGHEYEEPGYTASDAFDGDLTSSVTTEIKDDVVYYTVTDSSGNTAEAKREIVYDDRKAPVITLDGGEEVSWYSAKGEYSDSYSAEDDLDGDVTANVQVTGSVGSEAGDYTLTYTVKDSYGNEAVATRVIHVSDMPVNVADQEEDEYTVYLTFDDGPWQYTDQLLDTLAKYNAKVTFFVTQQYGYTECITREAAEGHTVAVHTFSHRYDVVYQSADAYWSDFNNMNQVIKDCTGYYTTLFRFPGGSSNTISANYCSGVVSAIADQAYAKGYEYFDWNVSSGDAGGCNTADEVYENVIAGIQKCTEWGVPSVVLQHDIKDFSVEAVEKILIWGLENGYHFSALQPGSYHAKHSIYN